MTQESGYLSEEIQNTNSKRYMHPYVHCSIIYNSRDVEATQVPISRWVNTKVVVHIYNGILFSHKKNKTLPFLITWIDLGGIMLSKLRQGKTDTIQFHLHVESKEQNKWRDEAEADSQIQRRNWWLPDGSRFGGLPEKGKRIEKYKLAVPE